MFTNIPGLIDLLSAEQEDHVTDAVAVEALRRVSSRLVVVPCAEHSICSSWNMSSHVPHNAKGVY